MVTETNIQDKIERWRVLADIFIRENSKVFIKDIFDNYYFCEILFVGEDSVHIQSFKGKRMYEKDRIYWANIVKFDKYEEREE